VVWTGWVWLRIGAGGELLEHANGPLGSIKGWGNYQVAAQLVVSRVAPSSMLVGDFGRLSSIRQSLIDLTPNNCNNRM
jgi:hypothetical protein